MLVNVHTRTWCDSVFLYARKDIAKAIRHRVKARDLTTAKGLRKTFDELVECWGSGLLRPWFTHGGDFSYTLASYSHKVYLNSLLAIMRILHQWPFEYHTTGNKIVDSDDGKLVLEPYDEARLMGFAITLKAIVEELRELELDAERKSRWAA